MLVKIVSEMKSAIVKNFAENNVVRKWDGYKHCVMKQLKIVLDKSNSLEI